MIRVLIKNRLRISMEILAISAKHFMAILLVLEYGYTMVRWDHVSSKAAGIKVLHRRLETIRL